MTDNSSEGETVTVHQETYFAQIPEWILFHPDLSHGAVRAYGVLARYAGKKLKAWPGQKAMGEHMQCSDRQVRTYLAELKSVGAMEEKRRRNKTAEYVLAFENPFQQDRNSTSTRDRNPASSRTGTVVPTNESNEREPFNESETLAPATQSAKRDLLFEAVCRVSGIDWEKLTKHARGPLNSAVKELRAVGATPEEVPRAAWNFKKRYPKLSLTPSALAKHWPSLGDSETIAQQSLNPGAMALAEYKERNRHG